MPGNNDLDLSKVFGDTSVEHSLAILVTLFNINVNVVRTTRHKFKPLRILDKILHDLIVDQC